ncbi:hypothetical protein [Streptomyces abikoensis]|uniref:hypothetical protein n=1 Tax=Streptomyces abikoensis TaxID=97398 RepID=UPI0016719378|nr:hypothetical protein [Streptomyces abikoensis]GGP72454.1 hypothetical protein GCM10010214_54310 [Streptomyces abikoensis]
MKLAIGDVVRACDDKALGTVAGVVGRGREKLVMIHGYGGMRRFTEPGGLELVARHTAPMTTGRQAVALIALGLALLAAYIGCRSARDLGASWLLSFLAGFGGYGAVMTAYQWWFRLTGPRRFRV